MLSIFLVNAILVLVAMTIWYGVAYKRKRLDTVDTAWGTGFVVVAWSTYLQHATKASLAVAILVSIWGIRLATHMWQRTRSHSEDDRRYQEISAKWQGNFWLRAYFSIFLLQGGLVLLISLPVFTLANTRLAGWEWVNLVGLMVWLIGFYFEVTADRQLKAYLSQSDRPKVLDTGLWKYSRHPNYFGEITMWWGIGIIALQSSYGWLGLIGPALLSFLIIFVSGIPPIEKRRAKNKDYREYMKRTSPLIPLPPRST